MYSVTSWCRFFLSNGHPSSAPWSLCCHCFEDEAFKTTTTGVTPTRWPVLATFSNGRSKINNNENTAYEWKHIFALFVVDRSYHRHRNNIKWPGVCGVLQEACFPKNPCQQVRTPLFKGYNENTFLLLFEVRYICINVNDYKYLFMGICINCVDLIFRLI